MKNPPVIPDPNEKLLPPGRQEPTGPLVGIIIVVLLLGFGALYVWGIQLNKRAAARAVNEAAAETASQ